MRLYDGLQRFELYGPRDSAPQAGDPVVADELERALRFAPPDALDRVVDFLVTEFSWHPADFDRHDAALARLVELIRDGQVDAHQFRPSGSEAGEVPTEDEAQALTDLVEDEDEDEVAARLSVAPPMGIAADSELEPPPMPAFEFETEPPPIPEFDFEVADPLVPAFDFEAAAPDPADDAASA
ncbi:MAG: hypothetical protein ACE37F_21435 [Nannocystaceae bacterium]|nr:hypothetical protein [bacterium]